MNFVDGLRAASAGVVVRDGLMDGYWYACEFPERPVEDGGTAFHRPGDLCRGCILAAEAALTRGDFPDAVGLYLDTVGEVETERGIE